MLDREAVRQWIVERSGVPPEEVTDDRAIFTSGLLDSFDLVELVTFVEVQTGRRVRPLDINMRNFDTVESVVTFGSSLP